MAATDDRHHIPRSPSNTRPRTRPENIPAYCLVRLLTAQLSSWLASLYAQELGPGSSPPRMQLLLKLFLGARAHRGSDLVRAPSSLACVIRPAACHPAAADALSRRILSRSCLSPAWVSCRDARSTSSTSAGVAVAASAAAADASAEPAGPPRAGRVSRVRVASAARLSGRRDGAALRLLWHAEPIAPSRVYSVAYAAVAGDEGYSALDACAPCACGGSI